MRELKFKILDKKNSKFINAFSANFAFAAFSILTGAIDPTGNLDNLKEDFDFIQFTGILDSNGKEIYEGDILKQTWRENYPYGYSPNEWTKEKNFCVVEYVAPSFKIYTPRQEQICIEDFKQIVVGNVFENPELLKKYGN